MVDIGELLGVVGALLAAVGAIAWALYHGISLFFRARPHLRGHLFAAVLWTTVTVLQTAVVLLDQSEPHTIGQGVALTAGFVMMASWAQFWERQDGMTYRQDKRPILSRLFTQSFWGVVALLGMAWGVTITAQTLFLVAAWKHKHATMQAISDAHLLSPRTDALEHGLCDAVVQQDVASVRIFLSVGVSPVVSDYQETSILRYAAQEGSTAISQMLIDRILKQGCDTDALSAALRSAAMYNQPAQARLLLKHGADGNAVSEEGLSALRIAKQRGYQPMIALLKSAGATR